MLAYSILMFAVVVLLFVFGVLIHRGNTKLIHDYHQTRVTDKQAYGKAFGKALIVFGAAPLASGIVALFGTSGKIAAISVAVLIVGIAIGFSLILKVQKKYNKGLF